MDQTVEDRIRTRAYLIWLEEGQPHGQDAEHWARAEAEVAANGAPAPAEPKRAAPRRAKKAETPTEAPASDAAPKKAARVRTGTRAGTKADAATAAATGDAAPKRTATRRRKTPDS